MQFRLGTCSSCNAQYKVPASFEAKQARCKSCGGVVEIGPVQSADEAKAEAKQPEAKPEPAKPAAKAPPVPARKPAPKAAAPKAPAPKAAEPAPAPKKREGPSMKEKLLARRAAEAEAASAAPAPAKPAAPEPVAAKPARSAPSRRPAAKPAAVAGKGKAGASDDAGGGEKSSRPSRSGSRSSSRSSRGRSGGRRGSGEKKGNPMLLIGSVLGLIIAGGAVWFLLLSGDDPVEAKNDETVAAAEGTPEESGAADADNDANSGADADANGDADSGDEPVSVEDGNAMIGTPEADGDDPAPADATGGDEGSDDTGSSTDEPATEKKPEVEVDVNSVDLSWIEDFGPVEGTSDDDWADIQKWAGQMIDPNAGAAGNRAKDKLFKAGKAAFPAVLNQLKELDFTTVQGRKDGDLCQRLLTDICNGNNFAWKYTTEPADVVFNKKVVEAWAKQWEKAKDSDEYWLRLSKQKVGGPNAAADEAKKKREKALDALDDL